LPALHPSSKTVRTPASRNGARNGLVHRAAQSRSSPDSWRCRAVLPVRSHLQWQL